MLLKKGDKIEVDLNYDIDEKFDFFMDTVNDFYSCNRDEGMGVIEAKDDAYKNALAMVLDMTMGDEKANDILEKSDGYHSDLFVEADWFDGRKAEYTVNDWTTI